MEKQILGENLGEIIEKTAKDLIEKMGFHCESELTKLSDEESEEVNYICNIKTEDSNFLIGQYGVNLQALQHILRVVIRKKTENRVNFVLDINSYRQEKNESVFSLAKNMAEKALVENKEVVLRPMSPYERRLVHMELSKDKRLKTESIGEGEDRRVVIKPSDLV